MIQPGSRVQLKTRPLTGKGNVVTETERPGVWLVKLDDGSYADIAERDLAPLKDRQ